MSLYQIVAATTSGVVYDLVPPNKSSSVRNNAGSATSITSTISTNMNGVSTATSNIDVFGSTVIDKDDTDKSLNAGVFAYDNEEPVAKRVTSSLSTVSNTYLISGAADPNQRRSPHKVESIRTTLIATAIREGYWNEYIGEFDAGYPASSVYYLPTQTNSCVFKQGSNYVSKTF